ncbi:hypothetical protein RHMOL_Rhmol03G0178300 [Rhododendron molle]|uniref:Uncharacterized protein n=1 Tax=Rhododendron molle TaxID=49168 RepID=A0ACC0PFQ1_RHOML|nr:hypothetical protein RHMOL_Rhmol03G0178300 [Rhododendron molle]
MTKCFLNSEADKSVEAMLKLIDEDGDSFGIKAATDYERKPDLIANAKGLCHRYKLLAERYDHLTGELRKYLPSFLQMQNSVISHSGSGQGSPLATPDFMSARTKFGQQSVSFDLFLSSGGSSDLSVKEGFESSSIGSDSELELFDSTINKHSNPHVTGGVEGLSGTEEVKVTKKKIPNFAVEIQENEDYEALLKRISKYDEELKETHKKLQLSEEVVVRLTGGFNKKDAFTVLIGDLQAQLDSAHGEIKVREADLEMEKRRGLELQMEIGNLVEELEIAREKLKVSEDESNEISQGKCQLQGQLELAQKFVATLESKLESEKMQVLELQEKIVKHIADVSKRDQEIQELNSALSNAQKTFTLDEMKLQSDISALSEELALSEARAVESQLRRKLLEIEISKSEVARKEMVCLHEAQQNGLRNEIEQLKANIAERGKTVEALNKKLDVLNLKYDRLVAEKDGLDAKVQMLIAEMDSRDKQIKRLEEDTRQMHIECVELTIGSESAQELVDELRVRVGELEKEVDKQRIVISDRAEEKREAIRQLCFSLEHYRSGYQELRQAFVGHKSRAVLAS